jgi:DNA-binding response OmpR family regulator
MAEPRNKILCIEDDRETVALLAEELAVRDFDVVTAYDGQLASLMLRLRSGNHPPRPTGAEG